MDYCDITDNKLEQNKTSALYKAYLEQSKDAISSAVLFISFNIIILKQ